MNEDFITGRVARQCSVNCSLNASNAGLAPLALRPRLLSGAGTGRVGEGRSYFPDNSMDHSLDQSLTLLDISRIFFYISILDIVLLLSCATVALLIQHTSLQGQKHQIWGSLFRTKLHLGLWY